MGKWSRPLEGVVVTPGFWKGRRVLVTGHTGFKGSWLSLWLQELGAHVIGLSLPPEHDDGAFAAMEPWGTLDHRLGDITDPNTAARAIRDTQPDVVFHLAAQALVRRGLRDPLSTYSTNVVGTANVLAALATSPSTRAVVVVTSDKVYAHGGRPGGCSEDDELGGADPYSASKACTELLVRSWRASFPGAAAIVTARAGNVVGGGDRAEDRLVPDVLRAIDDGRPVQLRNPEAIRPWQFVLEPLAGYLTYAEAAVTDPSSTPPTLNFGPRPGDLELSVAQVVDELSRLSGRGGWEPDRMVQPPELQTLRLNAQLAHQALGWRSRSGITDALRWTLEWHAAQRAGDDMRQVSILQIKQFSETPE